MNLKLYGFPRTRSSRVMWMLEELGVVYDFIRVDLEKGQHRGSAYRRINPAGKVPALVDGDFVLTESIAICTYLGDRMPDSGLVPPAGTRQRAEYDRWGCFLLSELEEPLWTMAKHRFALPAEYRVPAIKRTARWEFARAVAQLESGLDNREFAVGDRFTAADIFITLTLNWALNNRVPVPSEVVLAYARRHSARPALAKALSREQQGTPFSD